MNRTLYLFTNHYPYSATSECFIEDEIGYLCQKFSKVVLVPMSYSKIRRSVPDKCEIMPPLGFGKSKFLYFIYGIFNIKTAPLLIKDFLNCKVYKSKKRFKAWGAAAKYINNFANRQQTRKLIKQIGRDDVVYFYWGIGQNVLSVLLNNKVHSVSRFHGFWDLWEDSYGDYGALRNYITQSLDMAVSISRKGAEFLKKKYPHCNVIYSPLGTKDWGVCPPSPKDGVIRVVSCSHIYPLKRIPLIFKALNFTTAFNIQWTHIGEGDGNCKEELELLIKNECKDHLKVVLTDSMSHDEVMNYYRTHHVDVFINLSTSEGVPVAVMEALSFGIPVVATDVGGTSDEVTPKTGELLPSNPTIEQVSEALIKVTKTKYYPREFWEQHYSAEKNYTEFAKLLSEL